MKLVPAKTQTKEGYGFFFGMVHKIWMRILWLGTWYIMQNFAIKIYLDPITNSPYIYAHACKAIILHLNLFCTVSVDHCFLFVLYCINRWRNITWLSSLSPNTIGTANHHFAKLNFSLESIISFCISAKTLGIINLIIIKIKVVYNASILV